MQFVRRDGSLGLADQLGEASLAVDQRLVAQVVVVMLNQVGGEQHRLTATALALSSVPSSRAITTSPSISNDCLAPKPTEVMELQSGF